MPETAVWVHYLFAAPFRYIPQTASWDELEAKLAGLVPELLTLNGLIQAETSHW